MNKKSLLRIISMVMLLTAVVFVIIALGHPELGSVFYIGNIRIGAKECRMFYKAYLVIMVLIFAASFFIKNSKKES